jgi:hypothetical protein
MKYLSGLSLVLLALALVAPNGMAGEEARENDGKSKDERQAKDQSDEWKDQEIREMITTVMMARMSRELELTDEQTVVMVRDFADLRDTLSRLSDERHEVIETLRDKVDNGAPDAEIEPLLSTLMAVDEERDAVRRETFEKAGAGLTISQRAKLYIFVQDFEWHMRKLIMKAREIGGDRVKQWHDSVVSGEYESSRGSREGGRDRDRDRPKESPEQGAEQPASTDGQ